ncbi:MAG: EamA family transporter [Rudaea sp.]
MLTFALLLGTVLCEVCGQLCFKLGVGHEVRDASTLATHRFLLDLFRSRWIIAGVLVYVVEFTLWFAALSLTRLSFAYPFMALSYCGVVIASRFVLGERVNARRWLATFTVVVGVSLACWP